MLYIQQYHLLLYNEKKPHQLGGVFNVVGAAGVEPATAWFVARYSIQLSYAPSLAIFYILVSR